MISVFSGFKCTHEGFLVNIRCLEESINRRASLLCLGEEFQNIIDDQRVIAID